MGSEWTQVTLEDICLRITSGGTPSRRNPAYYEGGGWPWVKTQELQDGWIDDTEEHITEDAINSSSAKVLPEKTVLLAMYGATVGQLGILRRTMTCNQACCALIADPDKADFRFLYFYLLKNRSKLKNLATGAAQQNLSGAVIKSLHLLLPSLVEQRAIAHILGTLDDKIELNRQQNKTLEEMARALFKAWFVDFEPVRAKMEGRWQPGQTTPGLPAHLYDLFPDRLVETEQGEIPQGWGLKTLADIATFPNKKIEVANLKLEEYISTENMLPNKAGVACAASLPSVNKVSVFGEGEILISNIRPYFKKIWFAQFSGGRSNDVLAFESKEPDCKEFLYTLLCQDEFFEFMMRTSKGAKMPRGDKGAIAGWKFLYPGTKLMCAFSKQVQPFYSQTKMLDKENKSLKEVRDALLPKLISGELRISDAESFIKEYKP